MTDPSITPNYRRSPNRLTLPDRSLRRLSCWPELWSGSADPDSGKRTAATSPTGTIRRTFWINFHLGGTCQEQSNNHDDAIRFYTAALAAHPSANAARNNLGLLARSAKQTRRGRGVLPPGASTLIRTSGHGPLRIWGGCSFSRRDSTRPRRRSAGPSNLAPTQRRHTTIWESCTAGQQQTR